MNENKRIVINTVILYVKLIINIIVSFVSTRIVLDALGVSDYGLYNVVGGTVAMLNILGTSMVATSYRYMSVELGKTENGDPNRIYNTVFLIHLGLAFFLLVVGETLGVFYINNYLNVDHSKISDALFILHLSLLTTVFAVITIPMNGLIIAREKFLFTSIVESVSSIIKLILIVFLIYMDGNRLRIYAIFLAAVQFGSPVAYQVYCRVKDSAIVKWNYNKNMSDYKEVISFAWWMLIGSITHMSKMQGAAIIINYFFGTILNAAFGIASQVSNAVSQFTSTLRQAAIPQIMKSQSSGNEIRSINLVYTISRYSFLFMIIMAMPLLFCMDDVLKLWLRNTPEYTRIFVDFMLINGMISNLGAGFDASIQATGKVRKNQIGYTLINLALLPVIFILYKIGLPPYVNVIVMVILTFCTLIFQVHIMEDITAFNVKEYIRSTIIPCLLSTLSTFALLLPLRILFPDSITSILLLLFLSVAVILTCVSIFICGINKQEKLMLFNLINNKIIIKLKK